MQTLISILLSNALVAAAPAGLAWAVARSRWRRPAVVHALWVLALLKLVTPPVLPVDVKVLRGLGDGGVVAVASDVGAEVVPVAGDGERVGVAEAVGLVDSQTSAATGWPRVEWVTVVGVVWGAGSVFVLGLTLVRLARFNRLLRGATPAPADVRAEAARVAGAMGIGACPAAVVVPGAVSPMLWAAGSRARLLLPEGLWGRLGAAQRSALLAHELAHYRRRDHWVRHLELLASVVYWWHPLVWVGRGELRAAEEECCDAWVVHALPGHARAYATALLDTVDFVADGCEAAVPPCASGAGGGARDLKRRLVMILNGADARSMSMSLSWMGRAAVVGLGLVLLPALPKLAAADEAGGAGREVRRDGDAGAAPKERDGERAREGGARDGERAAERPREGERARGGLRISQFRGRVETVEGTDLRVQVGDRGARTVSTDGKTRVFVDGKPGALADLKPGMGLVVHQVEELTSVVDARTNAREAAGGEGGEVRRDGDRPREGERPKEGDKPREGDRPRDGDRPREGEGDRPREVRRDGDGGAAAGRLQGTVTQVEGTSLVLSVGEGGRQVTVPTDAATKVIISGQPGKLADVQPGMTVRVRQVEGLTTEVDARPGRVR